MTRALEPCGTKAGYMRHYRRGEERCDKCKAAHADKKPRRYTKQGEPSTTNKAATDMDLALERRPPVIVWQPIRGVQRAVYVNDPHTLRESQLLSAARTDI